MPHARKRNWLRKEQYSGELAQPLNARSISGLAKAWVPSWLKVTHKFSGRALNENLHLRFPAAGTLKRYYGFDTLLSSPRLFEKRIQVDIPGQHTDSPQIADYGPGPDSRKEQRGSSRREDTNLDVVRGAPVPW